MIEELINVRNGLGTGDVEVPVVRINYGENDYIIPTKAIIGDFIDQDKQQYKCALVGKIGGEEFSQKGTPHYKWNPLKVG
jgi:hypothetical protein